MKMSLPFPPGTKALSDEDFLAMLEERAKKAEKANIYPSPQEYAQMADEVKRRFGSDDG